MHDFATMMEKAANEKGDRIVLGDFNCDVLKGDSRTNKLLGIGLEYGLAQLIDCPTRVTKTTETTTDLMFTSVPMLLTRFGCEEVALSDHGLIYGVVPGAVKKRQNVQIVICWSKCDINAVMSDLEAAPWSAMESFDDIDDRWGYWKSLFLKILYSHLPLRKVRMRSQT